MRKFVALGTLAVLAVGAQAASAEGFNYNYVEGGYAFGDVESVDLSGFGVKGSWAVTPNIHVFGGYQTLNFDGPGSLKSLSLGAGYNWSLNESWDLIGAASFEQQKLGSSESGWGLGAGVRGRIGEAFEVDAGLKYADIGDFGNSTTFNVGGRYYFTPNFAVGAEYNRIDLGDANATGNTWGINVRYNFGM
jgi:opacity protein-like surface antigen